MNLDSIASMLTDTIDVEDTEQSEKQEELEEKTEDAPVEEKPENTNYRDPMDEDYKTEINNQMGCKIHRDEGEAQDRLTLWNKF